MIVNATQDRILARFVALRARLVNLYPEIGVELAREGADKSRNPFECIASACWAASQELAQVPGSWNLYVEARDLAAEAVGAGR